VVDVCCLFLQRSCNLDARGSVANGGDALACWVEVGVPVRRMAKMSLELLDAWVIWELPLIEVTVCRDDEVKIEVVNGRCSEV